VQEIININHELIKDFIYMVNKNYFSYDKNLSFLLEQKIKELYLLQKKRKRENFNLNEEKDISIQKDADYSLKNINKIKGNININQQSFPLNFEKIEINNTKKLQNKFSKNENVSPNNKLDNFKENMKINLNNDLSKNNSNKIINDYHEDSLKDPSNIKIPQNITSSKKINYFNVVQEDKPKKKLNKRKALSAENNNEIKVLKNNKVVYINTYLLNSYSSFRKIKRLNKIAFVGRNKRSSQYRGVSKNGYQWQVLIMVKNNKNYIGSYPSEELAARIYDILAIKNRGFKARTNFVYNNNQIKKICENEIDIKSENISDIIEELIK